MLGSLLLTFAISAAVLAVSAYISLLRVRRHAHVAERDDSARRLRFLVAAGVAGVGGFGIAALLSGGLVVASATAVVLAGSVLVAARLGDSSWAVRGVAVWALLVTAAAGFTAWVLSRLLTSSLSLPQLVMGGAALLLSVGALLGVRPHARSRIGALARGGTPLPEVEEHRDRRSLLSLGTLLAAAAVAVAIASGGMGPAGKSPAPDVRETGSPDTSSAPSSRESSPSSLTPGPSQGPGQASATRSPRGADGGSQDAGTERPATTGEATPTSGGTSNRTASPGPQVGTAARTPGYAKDKPNRPTDAPSPGLGRRNLP